MSATGNASAVTLTLNLAGSKAAITQLQAFRGEVTATADQIVADNERIAASAAATAEEVTAGQQTMADEAETTALRVDDANATAAASYVDLSAKVTASADTIEADLARIKGAGKAMAAPIPGVSSAGAASGESSLLGMLTSMKTLAATGAVYLGVKSFTDYNTALTKLSTQAGLMPAQLAAVESSISSLTKQTETSKKTLAQGFYNPISEGYSVSQSATIEQYSAKLAHIGGVPLAGPDGTSYAMSSMLRTLGLAPTQQNVAKVAGLINGTVGSGDMTMTQFLGAQSTGIFNTAQVYGVPAAQIGGALAYGSSQGVNPQEFATRMRMTMSLLGGNSAQAAKFAGALGLNATEVNPSALSQELTSLKLDPTKMASVMRGPGGLPAAFNMITAAMKGLPQDQQTALWAKLFGGGRSDATAMTLAQGAESGVFQQFVGRVASNSQGSSVDSSYKTWQSSEQGRIDQFTSSLSNLATSLGKAVSPEVNVLLGALGHLFNALSNPVAAGALAVLLGGVGFLQVIKLGSKLMDMAKGLEAVKLGRDLTNLSSESYAAESGIGKLITRIGALTAATEAGTAPSAASKAAGYAGPAAAIVAQITAAAALQKASDARHGKGVIGSLEQSASFEAQSGVSILQHMLDVKHLKLPFGLAAGGQVPAGPVGAGFVTNTPRAIVGEGGPHPEFVIPTDPAYRQRALGLYASLGGQLMADGGIVGQSLFGSGAGLLSQLSQLTSGNPTGALKGILGSLGGQKLTGAEHTVLAAISTAVPAGLFRSMMLGLVGDVFGLAMGGDVAGAATKPGVSAGAAAVSGSFASVQALGRQMAAARGWTGGEWTDLNALIMRESGWNPTAQNPTSSAYGIGQNINGPSGYPDRSVAGQIAWTLNYIAGRYGDPMKAWAHETGSGWYAKGGVLPVHSFDQGGLLPEGLSIAHNGTGKPEPVGHNLVPAGGGDLTVPLVVDGKVLAQAVIKDFRRQLARA